MDDFGIGMMRIHFLTFKPNGEAAKANAQLGSIVPRTALAPTWYISGCVV